MENILSENWFKLEKNRPIDVNLTARIAIPNLSDRLFCALDSEGIRHFLIILNENDEELQDAQSRGLNIESRDLQIPGQLPARYVDIACLDKIGIPIFDIIGYELATELSEQGKKPGEAIKQVLTKWRRFWGKNPQKILDRAAILGLFAELWFLYYWLIPSHGVSSAVQKWRGPFGSRHDFEWQGTSIEVKATTSSRGRIHWINGIEQLIPPNDGILFLYSLRLREEQGATNTIVILIQKIIERISSDETALNSFETILMKTGYSPLHNDVYSNTFLSIVEEKLFIVEKDFPRLMANQIINGIPSGVERIEYEINLNTFNHLIIANNPDGISFD